MKLLELNIQQFAERKKNALTKHYIAPIPEGDSEPDYMRLAKWIHTFDPSNEEEVEEEAYYDGDGTLESDVVSVKLTYAFDGWYLEGDEAHEFLRSIERKKGSARKVMYKQERQDGTVLEGPATITDLVTTGGPASEYEPIRGTVAWDKEPEETENTEPDPEG